MPRPLIGITCGTSALDPHARNPQDRLNTAYSRAVALAGGVPVVLPTGGGPDAAGDVLSRLDGLLLSGGYDVDPSLFGEERHNGTLEIDAERDTSEVPLIRAALKRDMPIFAICRGIQVLNVVLGGTLIQDIPSQYETPICHSQGEARAMTTHRVQACGNSRLRRCLDTDVVDVNSFHHQALKVVAAPLRATATAPDGIVEAAEMDDATFIVGVQWHPEELVTSDKAALNLFRAFVGVAAGERLT
jgi:putative glutamine amidotransferase